MKKDDELRRKLAEMFEDFEAEPQTETWEHIREAIGQKRKRRRFGLFFWLAGLGLLVGTGLISTEMLQVGETAQAPVEALEKTFITREEPWKNVSAMQQVATQSSQNEVAATLNSDHSEAAPPMPGILFFPKIQADTPASKRIVLPTKTRYSTTIDPLSDPEETAAVPDQSNGDLALLPLDKTEQKSTQQDGNELNVLKDTLQDHLKIVGIPVLPPRAVSWMVMTDQPLPPVLEQAVLIQPHQAKRKGRLMASAALLSAYQLMEYGSYDGKGATNIRLLPAVDASRLGTSWSVGYRLPIRSRSDVGIALTWMNLPYRVEYDVKNTRQVQVEIQSDNDYRILPTFINEVSEVKRQNWWGVQVEYGYTYSLFHQNIRVFAGGEGLVMASASRPEGWIQAGLDIPIAQGRYQLSPVFKYQLNRIKQPDHLIQTRLYTLGLGIKKRL